MGSLGVVWVLVGCLSYSSGIRFGRMLPPRVEYVESVDTSYFPQILDHNAATPTFWDQRYFVNAEFWKGGTSPVFLMVGGEGEASPAWMTGGAWVEWAIKYGALLIQLEHRFYGNSHPTEDASTENLSMYLSSEQALGDITYFIEQINIANNFTAANKWILFGGSYPGNLVAWARLKHPKHVFGAVSSSGPLQAKADFTEYNDVVRDSLNYYSKGCADEVTKAVNSALNLLKTQNGRKKLNSKMPICSGFNYKKRFDRVLLVEAMTGEVSSAVQYNNQQDDNSIEKVCSYMTNTSVPDPLDRLAEYHNATTPGCLYGSYAGQVAYYQQTDWNANVVSRGDRQWLFQTCNEFGYYQTSETKDSYLGDSIPLDYFTQTCTDVFGPDFNATQLNNAVDSANRYYEGTKIKVKNVVFVQGSIDPWHALGMVQKPTTDDPLLYIKGTSHCYDTLSSSSSDPPALKAARKTIDSYIKKWTKM